MLTESHDPKEAPLAVPIRQPEALISRHLPESTSWFGEARFCSRLGQRSSTSTWLVGVWGWTILCGGGILRVVRCFAASLASTRRLLGAPQMSRNHHMSPRKKAEALPALLALILGPRWGRWCGDLFQTDTANSLTGSCLRLILQSRKEGTSWGIRQF